MYAAEEDPYCYPGTTVLRNVFDIRDAVVLEQLELELTIARADEPLPHGALDRVHYCAIHRHFFQDIYPWAGQVRTVRISKGSSHFCYPEYIEAQLDELFAKLAADRHFDGLPPETFAKRAAAFLATLNVIHAFREGNGRTQLSFMIVLAERAGHNIDIARLDPEAMLRAMILSFQAEEGSLADIILQLIV